MRKDRLDCLCSIGTRSKEIKSRVRKLRVARKRWKRNRSGL